MSDIKWEDPPNPNHRGRGRPSKYEEALPALRSNPGKWAVIARYENRGGAYAAAYALTKRGFDAVGRSQDDKSGLLYARWPETEAAADD